MQRITEIRLRNYRAFGNKEAVISLPKGENLLVYGENGSGKSSLYWALRDVFESSVNSALKFNRNRFAPALDPGYVRLTLAENPHQLAQAQPVEYIWHSDPKSCTTQGIQELELAYKQQGFLTYKEIVESYLTPLSTARPNLYRFLVDELLAHHELPNAGQPIGAAWKTIATDLRKGPGQIRQGLWNREIPQFTQNLGILLGRISVTARSWLTTYFGPTIELADARVQIVRHGNSLMDHTRRLEVDLRFHAADLTSYQNTLNEARLSALAVCLYLAALKEYPSDLPFKPLVLDDIFVGLDTNNRLPLLNLLQTEFVAKHYQLILTTYDREWFALCGQWFRQRQSGNAHEWQQLEMFEAEAENVPGVPLPQYPFQPVLIPTKGNLARATAYFEARDYPAAGNYLRKEVERLLQDHLPLSFCITGEGERKMRDLNGLLDGFREYYVLIESELLPENQTLVKLDFDVLAATFRRLIFNPASHQDLRSPLYRTELQQALAFVEKLDALPLTTRRTLLPKGSLLVYEHGYRIEANGSKHGYRAEYELTDNLCVLVTAGLTPRLLDCKHKLRGYTWNNETYPENPHESKLSARPRRIVDYIEKKTGAKIEVNWQQDFVTAGNVHLLALPFPSDD
jgi:energy-coupling factor transporter ATP-binding protein EcfA2